jgi:hypothetical protein
VQALAESSLGTFDALLTGNSDTAAVHTHYHHHHYHYHHHHHHYPANRQQ